MLDIAKMVTISTAHITAETVKLMDNTASILHRELIIFNTGFGWIIYCNTLNYGAINESLVPDDLLACMKFACKNACEWLRLDSDAEMVDELPTYDW